MNALSKRGQFLPHFQDKARLLSTCFLTFLSTKMELSYPQTRTHAAVDSRYSGE